MLSVVDDCLRMLMHDSGHHCVRLHTACSRVMYRMIVVQVESAEDSGAAGEPPEDAASFPRSSLCAGAT